MTSNDKLEENDKLEKYVTRLLGGSLGLSILPTSLERPSASSWFCEDYRAGFQIGALYALLFCAIPWLLSRVFHTPCLEFPRSLLFLQIYGSLWCGWATASTRMVSAPILRTIKANIIPALPASTAEAITKKLTQRFDGQTLLHVSWAIGMICAVAAGALIYYDAPTLAKPPIGEVIWWSFGWWILFATAAKVVNVGRFYRLFAGYLEDPAVQLYAIDPARSTLVTSVASIGQMMLLFWLGIAVSIAAIIPFAVFGAETPKYSSFAESFSSLPHNSFVFAEVPIAGFFSIGLGTIVFLRSEAAIRRAVGKTSTSTLRSIEIQIGSLSDLLASPQADLGRLEKLKALHRDVATAGSYRSLLVSGLSLILPFIPLASVMKGILSWLGAGSIPSE